MGALLAAMNFEDFYVKLLSFFGIHEVLKNDDNIDMQKIAVTKPEYGTYQKINASHSVCFFVLAAILVVYGQIRYWVFGYMLMSQIVSILLIRAVEPEPNGTNKHPSFILYIIILLPLLLVLFCYVDYYLFKTAIAYNSFGERDVYGLPICYAMIIISTFLSSYFNLQYFKNSMRPAIGASGDEEPGKSPFVKNEIDPDSFLPKDL